MIFKPIPRQKSCNTFRDLWRVFCLLATKRFWQGEETREFETLFAEKYGMKYALATGSCRSAFALLLDALEIKSGDEVILPAYNMPAFPKILKCKGIQPVFIDINENTLNMDERLIGPKISSRTKAIVAVHLFGNACPMDEILSLARKHNLYVIEDCANAWGACFRSRYVGTFGDAACFSLGATKDIPTFGGGMILTNNQTLFDKLACIYEQQTSCPSWGNVLIDLARNMIMLLMGFGPFYSLLVFPVQFLCSRAGFDLMDYLIEEKDRPLTAVPQKKYVNFQAVVGLHQFKPGEQNQQRRIWNARILNARLRDIPEVHIPQTAPEGDHTYWNYPLLVPRRGLLVTRLLKHGISTKILDTYNCNQLKTFSDFRQDCPRADRIANTVLILPVYHHLHETEMNFIAETIKKECQCLV